MNDPVSSLKDLLKSGDEGDAGAACLGFAGGLIIDIALHGTSLGTAAVAGATAAVGVKRSIAAIINSSRGGTEALKTSRRLARRHAGLNDLLRRIRAKVGDDDPYVQNDLENVQRRLYAYSHYFEVGLLTADEYEQRLMSTFDHIRELFEDAALDIFDA